MNLIFNFSIIKMKTTYTLLLPLLFCACQSATTRQNANTDTATVDSIEYRHLSTLERNELTKNVKTIYTEEFPDAVLNDKKEWISHTTSSEFYEIEEFNRDGYITQYKKLTGKERLDFVEENYTYYNNYDSSTICSKVMGVPRQFTTVKSITPLITLTKCFYINGKDTSKMRYELVEQENRKTKTVTNTLKNYKDGIISDTSQSIHTQTNQKDSSVYDNVKIIAGKKYPDKHVVIILQNDAAGNPTKKLYIYSDTDFTIKTFKYDYYPSK